VVRTIRKEWRRNWLLRSLATSALFYVIMVATQFLGIRSLACFCALPLLLLALPSRRTIARRIEETTNA
jgi:predicted exporter